MTLREATEAVYLLAQEHGLPGLDPDVIQSSPTGHILHQHIEAARRHLESALEMARAEVAPSLRLVAQADGKDGAA